jgi:hypothetical protein
MPGQPRASPGIDTRRGAEHSQPAFLDFTNT